MLLKKRASKTVDIARALYRLNYPAEEVKTTIVIGGIEFLSTT